MATVKEDSYGGYDYTFVNGDSPSNYICHICTLVSHDPHQVSCCYNIFCKSCLETQTKQEININCPMCREPLGTNSYFKDGRLEREIKSPKIYCTCYDKEGCQWEGSTSDFIREHVHTCSYQLIECTRGCGTKILRTDVEAHLSKVCPKRMVSCEYCRRKGPHNLITSAAHLNECSLYPLKCRYEGCDVTKQRMFLSGHEKVCSKAVISCEYSSVGCMKVMKREDQERHNEEFMKEHLQMAVKRVDSLQMKCSVISSSEVFKVNDFVCKQCCNEVWHSPPFYSSPGGYKMILSVYANGKDSAKGTYISCYTSFVPGEYDDTLEWPFQGKVKLTLLNQTKKVNHRTVFITYNSFTPEECKFLTEARMSEEWGVSHFVPHCDLCPLYDRRNCLYFKVNVIAVSETKPWLAGLD